MNVILQHNILVAVWTRLELATPCVTGRYSNQLNYQTVLVIYRRKARPIFSNLSAQRLSRETGYANQLNYKTVLVIYRRKARQFFNLGILSSR